MIEARTFFDLNAQPLTGFSGLQQKAEQAPAALRAQHIALMD